MRSIVMFVVFFPLAAMAGGGWMEDVSISELSCDGDSVGAALKSVFAATEPATGYIMFLHGVKGGGNISMKASNTPLEMVLQALCRQGGLKYRPSKGRFVLVGAKIGEPAVATKGLEGLGKTRLKEFQVDDAAPEEFFKKLAAALKRNGGGIELKYLSPGASGKKGRSKRGRRAEGDDGDDDTFFGIDWQGKGAGKLSVSLGDVSLRDLLEGVSALTGAVVSVSGKVVTVAPPAK